MGNRFASGKYAIALCDVCGARVKLKELRALVVKGKPTNVMACRDCWSPDHPQLQLGSTPVDDPQALRNARPERDYEVSGLTVNGTVSGGSRIFAWGWDPVGGGDARVSNTPNPLVMRVEVGTVSVEAA